MLIGCGIIVLFFKLVMIFIESFICSRFGFWSSCLRLWDIKFGLLLMDGLPAFFCSVLSYITNLFFPSYWIRKEIYETISCNLFSPFSHFSLFFFPFQISVVTQSFFNGYKKHRVFVVFSINVKQIALQCAYIGFKFN